MEDYGHSSIAAAPRRSCPPIQTIIARLQAVLGGAGLRRRAAVPHRSRRRHLQPGDLLRCLDARPWRAAYVEPSTRPADGRYGENPYRLGHYYQYQVVIKPSPADIQDVYLQSLVALGIKLEEHDVRFVEDNWEGPTLGAWGLGWEVWIDGMEATQFTYFQQLGGVDCDPVTVELTYGLERIAMYLQGVDSVYDLVWSQWEDEGELRTVTYGDVYQENEREFSRYNFEVADTDMLYRHFREYEAEAERCLAAGLPSAGLRLRAQVQPHLQPARRARRHQRHRPHGAHRARARPGAQGGEAVLARRSGPAPATKGSRTAAKPAHLPRGPGREHTPARDRLRGAAGHGLPVDLAAAAGGADAGGLVVHAAARRTSAAAFCGRDARRSPTS